VSAPLVVVDADVLGRRRTGDERYVLNLLRELPGAAPDLRLAAVTRRPDLVPAGVEPVELRARSQELRLAVTLPRLLRRMGADLVHTQYAAPLLSPCPVVVTIHDLSFERDAGLMPARDRFVFRRVVPRAARGAARVLTVSERSRRDLVELYGVPRDHVVVTPNAVDPVFTPGEGGTRDYLLAVGAVEPKKDQLAALAAAQQVGLPLVVAGPVKDEGLATQLRAGGARLTGWVDELELVGLLRGAAALVQASRFEGFGLPVLEAMACGTPVAIVAEPALVEVAAGAAAVAEPGRLADAVRTALSDRERLVAAGLERVRTFTWRATAEWTAQVYRVALRR
jgi:glycosyltransferase involved in cell wall biosynthesis